ncbi:MAG TPA: rod shape-determining protein RodA [Rickettsiales bacterium]|nr:rod shape-determining protein RodA [Rickettsiales bacterium]
MHHSPLAKLTQLNWLLTTCIFLMALLGFAMMFSAAGGHMAPWASHQMMHFTFGFILMTVIAVTPVQTLLRYSYAIYIICLIVLVGIEVAGFIGKGAKRWIDVGGVNLQPSEIMKLAVILALARYFHSENQADINRLVHLVPPLLLVAVPAVFILRQPNLGTATILTFVGASLFYMAGVRTRYFLIIIAVGLMAAPVGWHFLHDYQKQRVMTFLHPEENPLGAGYNIMQSIIAIGSGGFFGKGYLHGSQGQLNFLPEKHTDFIFTMVAEEFGFLGCVFVLAVYLTLIGYGIAIGLRSRHTFGSFIAIGVSSMLFVHIIINTMMIMGLIPVVGVPLPMLSYGGSSMISILIGFGFMQNAYINRDVNLPRRVGLL